MQASLRQKRGPQAGITLIELLVGMVIVSVLSTMLVSGWISLQRSNAYTVSSTTAQASARDALDRVASELRDCQSLTTSGTPFVSTSATECDYYSAYNQPGVDTSGGSTATGALRLTRIYIGNDPYAVGDARHDASVRWLWWQRDTDNSGTFTSADRQIALAQNVVNTRVSPTIDLFTYYDKNVAATTVPANVAMVTVKLAIDSNLNHPPKYVEIDTTVRPRNGSGS
jgi:prepilin-type N-terminal cleavage/methylation domain-containing protein